MTIERNRKHNSKNHRTNRPVLAGILFFCCLLLSGTGFLYLRLGNGVQIKVSLDKNIPPAAEIICYRQDDAQWGDDKLGSSSYTMRSSGCLVSCIAAALSMERSTEETPGTLNRRLMEDGFMVCGACQHHQLPPLLFRHIKASGLSYTTCLTIHKAGKYQSLWRQYDHSRTMLSAFFAVL